MAKVRKTIEMDAELEKTIQEMADKKKWSFSTMGNHLLSTAVKEVVRKRSNIAIANEYIKS